MKLRSHLPRDIRTNSNTGTKKHPNHPRPSVDDDFAPSITPSSADSEFPRFYHYYPPLDPTWRMKHHITSPDTPEPKIKSKMRGKSSSSSKKKASKTKSSKKNELHTVQSGGILKSQRTKPRKSPHTSDGTMLSPLLMVQFDKTTLNRPAAAKEPETKRFRVPSAPVKAAARKTGPNRITTIQDIRSQSWSPRSPRDRRHSVVHRGTMNKVNARGNGNGRDSQVILTEPRIWYQDRARRKSSTIPKPKLSPRSQRKEDFLTQLEEAARARRASTSGALGKENEVEKSRALRRASSVRSSWSGKSVGSIERIRAFEARHSRGQRLGKLTSPTPSPQAPQKQLANTERAFPSPVRDTRTVLGSQGKAATKVELPTQHFNSSPKNATLTASKAQSFEEVVTNIPELISQLGPNPELLTLAAVGPTFTYLQTEIQDFAEDLFNFRLSPAQRAAWPLHELGTRYLPLMLVTQYIADGSQYGWRHFFTHPASRVALVQGVVGEWFKQRVFNHTCFGLSTEQIQELEDMDREYLHHDAFLRSKKRAEMVKGFLAENPVREGSMEDAVNGLRDELMVVLEPLMEGFMPMTQGKDGEADEDEIEELEFPPDEIKELVASALETITREAVVLHHAIRLLGRDGTIVRIAPAVQKGDRYYKTAPFHIVNEEMVEKTKSHGVRIGREDDGKLAIKMTCFGRIEAYVPHGPDFEELVAREARIKKGMAMRGERKKDFDWENYAESVWPELPESIVREEKRKLGELTEESVGDDEVEEAKMYGPYVTCYLRLAPHQVYCEWIPEGEGEVEDGEQDSKEGKVMDFNDGNPQQNHTLAPDGVYEYPLPKSQRVSLKDAVQKARKEAGLWTNTIEDTARSAWNFACKWESIPETIVLAWFIQSWVRGGSVAEVGTTVGLLGSAEGRAKLAEGVRGGFDGARETVTRVGRGIGRVGERVRSAVAGGVLSGRVEKFARKVGKDGKEVWKHVKVQAAKGAGKVNELKTPPTGVVPNS